MTTAEQTETVAALTGAAPTNATYSPPARWRRIDGAAGTAFEGLWIEVKRNLTGAELQVIQAQQYWADIHEVMAPYVRAWNLEGDRVVTEERPAIVAESGAEVIPARTVERVVREPLPPPAEAGPDVFAMVDKETKFWIRTQLLNAPFGGDDRGKGSPPSAPGPRGTPPAATDPASPNRKRRGSSKKR